MKMQEMLVILMPISIFRILGHKGNHLIHNSIYLLEDVMNRYYDKKIKQPPDVIK